MARSRAARARDPLADTALIAVFAALIAAFSAFVPGVAVGPAPITLQTLAVALVGLVLGPVRGCLAVLLYLVVGFAGLPVFAQGAAGPGVLASASIGYLLSFPVAAWLIGLGAGRCRRGARRRLAAKLTALTWAVSLVVIHPAGIVGLTVNTGMSLGAAALYDLRFWPGDLVKGVLAGLIAAVVHRAFPSLGVRPARVDEPPADPVAPVVASSGPPASAVRPVAPAVSPPAQSDPLEPLVATSAPGADPVAPVVASSVLSGAAAPPGAPAVCPTPSTPVAP